MSIISQSQKSSIEFEATFGNKSASETYWYVGNNLTADLSRVVLTTTTSNSPIVEYLDCSASFNWGQLPSCIGPSTISLLATNDSLPIILIASLKSPSELQQETTADIYLEGLAFNAWALIDDTNIIILQPHRPSVRLTDSNFFTRRYNFSAVFANGADDEKAISNWGPVSYEWNIIPSDFANIITSTDSHCLLEINGTGRRVGLLEYKILDHSQYRTIPQLSVTIDENLRIWSLDETHNSLHAALYSGNNQIDPSQISNDVNWTVQPPGAANITYPSPPPKNIHINLTATTLVQYISIIADVDDAISNEYIFRPYLSPEPSTTFNARTSLLSENNINTIFNVYVYGITGSIEHNYPPHFLLYWDNQYGNVVITSKNTDTVLAPFTPGVMEMFGDVYITINNPPMGITAREPRLLTYTIPIKLLNSNDINDVDKETTITLQAYEFVPDEIFSIFTSINENEPSNIYCVSNIEDNRIPLNIKLHPSSILPPTGGGTYRILKVGNPPLLEGVWTRPEDIQYILNVSEYNDSDIIRIEIVARFGSVNITKAYETEIRFFNDIDLTEDNIVVYPEYIWNASNKDWQENITKDETKNAVGFCKTENFCFELMGFSGIDVVRYEWQVIDGEEVVASGEGFNITDIIRIPVRPPIESKSYDVKLIIYIDDGVCRVSKDIIKENAVRFDGLNVEDYSLYADIPETVSFPGNLRTYLGIDPNGNISGDLPVSFDKDFFVTTISCSYWDVVVPNNNASLRINETGGVAFGLPNFETTELQISVQPILLIEKRHPIFNDWCRVVDVMGKLEGTTIAYPIIPSFYTPNKYLETSDSIEVIFNNNIYFKDINEEVFTWITIDSTSDSLNSSQRWIRTYTPNDYYMSLTYEGRTTKDNDALRVLDSYTKYDKNVVRTIDSGIRPLPYTCGIGRNEFVTHDTINLAFKKIQDNIKHIINEAKLYDDPPFEYFGWLGSHLMADDTTRFRWFLNKPVLNHKFNNPDYAIDDIFSNLGACAAYNSIIYASNNHIDDNNNITQSTLYAITPEFLPGVYPLIEPGQGTPFKNIKTIQCNSDGMIYILDSLIEENCNNEQKVITAYHFTNNKWQFAYSWGGPGGTIEDEYKFNNPNDLHINPIDNTVWVVDTKNKAIKKYYRTGNWFETIPLEFEPISICRSDSTNHTFILDINNTIHILDGYDNKIIKTFKIDNNKDIIKLQNSNDNGFSYALFKDTVVKFNYNGETQLKFSPQTISPNYVFNNTSIYQDEYKNLYITQNNTLLKFYDEVKLISLIHEDDVLDKMWQLEDLEIHKDEYIQDWVINRYFGRLWDNIEMLRRSIVGKLSYRNVINTLPPINPIDSVPNDPNCEIDWWPVFTYNPDDLFACFSIPDVRTFFDIEYHPPIYEKDEIYIGINETVSADVINRPLCQLQANLQNILDMISESDGRPDLICENVEMPVFDLVITKLDECYPEFYKICEPEIDIIGDTEVLPGTPIEYKLEVTFPDICKYIDITNIVWEINDIIKQNDTVKPNTSLSDYTFTYTYTPITFGQNNYQLKVSLITNFNAYNESINVSVIK